MSLCSAPLLSEKQRVIPVIRGVPLMRSTLTLLIFFELYIQTLSKIIQHHALYIHSVSGDNQLDISANLSRLQEIMRASLSCVPAGSLSRSGDVTIHVKDINQPSLPTPFYSDLVSISLLWPFQLYFIPLNIPTTLRFLTLFFRSYLCLIGPFNSISL